MSRRLILQFGISLPVTKKNGRVSNEAQPTSNQKTIVLQKEFSLSGRIAVTPLPLFKRNYIFILGPRAAISFQKEGRNKNQSNLNDSPLFIIVEVHKSASLLSIARTIRRSPNCREIRITAFVRSVGAVAAPLLCCFHD